MGLWCIDPEAEAETQTVCCCCTKEIGLYNVTMILCKTSKYLAELILDDGKLHAMIVGGKNMIQQGRLATPEETREDGDGHQIFATRSLRSHDWSFSVLRDS